MGASLCASRFRHQPVVHYFFSRRARTRHERDRPYHQCSQTRLPPLLHPLDPWSDTSRVLIAPLIQLLLVSLFWVTYASSFTISLFLSIYHAALQLTIFSLTFWRSETLTAPYSGPRVREREYSSSKVVSLDDIRLCQRAFSGTYPGSAVHKERGGRSKVGHVTINDIMCSVMADVLGEEIASQSSGALSLSRLKKTLLDRFLPSPIGFLMYARSLTFMTPIDTM